jgi:ribosomal protein L11 methyltransferase
MLSPSGYKIEFVCKQAAVQEFGAALDDFTVAVAAFEIVPGGEWRIEAYTIEEPDEAGVRQALSDAVDRMDKKIVRGMPDFRIVPLPPVDWLAQNKRNFPPQGFGRFFIHGSHFEGTPPHGRIVLLLDAATAFGSGEHETTRGCLIAIGNRAKLGKIRNPLDVGCGSGILALALAKIFRVPVLASDIDAESVRVARENAEINRVHRLVRVVGAAGYRHREIKRKRPYDLIVSNILARPLCALAPDLRRHIAPGGTVILSGLLEAQETQVLAAHRAQGLVLVSRQRRAGWSTLTLKRKRRRL